jgi:transposase
MATVGGAGMVEDTADDQEIIARVAALDIGKAELVCCARVPGTARRGSRAQEVVTYSTMTRSLLVMARPPGPVGGYPGGDGGH